MGVCMDWKYSDFLYEADLPFILGDNIFCTLFTAESIIGFFAFKEKWRCLLDPVFRLDAFLALCFAIETWIVQPVMLFTTDSSTRQFLASTRPFQLLRVARLVQL